MPCWPSRSFPTDLAMLARSVVTASRCASHDARGYKLGRSRGYNLDRAACFCLPEVETSRTTSAMRRDQLFRDRPRCRRRSVLGIVVELLPRKLRMQRPAVDPMRRKPAIRSARHTRSCRDHASTAMLIHGSVGEVEPRPTRLIVNVHRPILSGR